MSDSENARAGPAQKVVWDDTDMRQTFANVVTVAATNEEVSVLFGTNKEWRSDAGEMHVRLSDRMMLTPHAAKRLLILLDRTMRTYEERHGPIRVRPDRTG